MAIGVLCALFAGVFRYVDDHFHDPETFLDNTSELRNNAAIQERLFNGFRDEIIQIADGELGEQPADDATSDFSDELDSLDDGPDPFNEARILRDIEIEDIIRDVFRSDLYDEVFLTALADARNSLIESANLPSEELLSNNGEVFLNMRPLYATLYPRLGENELTAEIPQNVLPDGYGIFKVADRDTTVNFLWTFLRNAPNWRGLTTLAAIASFIGAVAIAERRPSTAIQFGAGLVGVGVVVVVVVFLIRFIVPLLSGGGGSAGSVEATYAANTWPLVGTMIRLGVLGLVIAIVGGIAKLIWPDDWVYSSVSDERGVRSIRRRRSNKGEPEPQQQQVAAAVPVGYPGYPQPYAGYPQPYPGYPTQQWPQPYPGQHPPAGYPGGYPVGPYAQPTQPAQQYTSPGRPTVPVMPVQQSPELVPPAAPPLDSAPTDLPADAAQIVPRVVAHTNDTSGSHATTNGSVPDDDAGEPTEAVDAVALGVDSDDQSFSDAVRDDDSVRNSDATGDADDEWATERDW